MRSIVHRRVCRLVIFGRESCHCRWIFCYFKSFYSFNKFQGFSKFFITFHNWNFIIENCIKNRLSLIEHQKFAHVIKIDFDEWETSDKIFQLFFFLIKCTRKFTIKSPISSKNNESFVHTRDKFQHRMKKIATCVVKRRKRCEGLKFEKPCFCW